MGGTAGGGGRGSALDDVRRRNLAAVLGLVHANGRLKRTELVRETGLNRSTIAAIVIDLTRRGLVEESAPHESAGVGRPSFVITPAVSTVAVAVNPEVDAVTVALIALGGNVVRRFRFEHLRTPAPQEVVNVVTAVLEGIQPELSDRLRTVGIGIAVPGLVREHDGLVVLAPRLGWRDVPFAAMLADATGYPVRAANDATCGVVAEHVFGAGRGVHDLVFLNGGASGIGGGVIAADRVLTGVAGYAGEFGHTLVAGNGRPCLCGSDGCLETELLRDELLDAVGLDATRLDQLDTVLAEALAGGDRRARAIVDHQAALLAVALRNIVNALNPQVVALGGFLGTLLDVAGDEMTSAVRRSALPGPRADVEIVRAPLRHGLLVGAAEYVFSDVLRDPTRVRPVDGVDIAGGGTGQAASAAAITA